MKITNNVAHSYTSISEYSANKVEQEDFKKLVNKPV